MLHLVVFEKVVDVRPRSGFESDLVVCFPHRPDAAPDHRTFEFGFFGHVVERLVAKVIVVVFGAAFGSRRFPSLCTR